LCRCARIKKGEGSASHEPRPEEAVSNPHRPREARTSLLTSEFWLLNSFSRHPEQKAHRRFVPLCVNQEGEGSAFRYCDPFLELTRRQLFGIVFGECPPQSIIIFTTAIILAMPRDGLIPDGNHNRSSFLEPAATNGGLLFLEHRILESRHFGSEDGTRFQ
jgi:hypothetical protein